MELLISHSTIHFTMESRKPDTPTSPMSLAPRLLMNTTPGTSRSMMQKKRRLLRSGHPNITWLKSQDSLQTPTVLEKRMVLFSTWATTGKRRLRAFTSSIQSLLKHSKNTNSLAVSTSNSTIIGGATKL